MMAIEKSITNQSLQVVSRQLLKRYVAGERDFRQVNLSGETMSWACLKNADLQEANLDGTILQGASLSKANLRSTSLRGINLMTADLAGANLTDANLTDANLREADLQGADLTGANITDADLTDANLRGTKMPDGTVMSAEQLVSLSGERNRQYAKFMVLLLKPLKKAIKKKPRESKTDN